MTKASLIISRRDETRVVELNPKGMLVGRSPECDVVLDSGRVSRRHARIFQDPFGRWIVEDLGSRHGVWMGQQQVPAATLLPGDKLAIGPFTLSLAVPEDRQIKADPALNTSTTMMSDDLPAEFVPSSQSAGVLDQAQIKRLNTVMDHLASLTSPGELYPEACQALIRATGGLAAILRVPGPTEELAPPQVLACCVADQGDRIDRHAPANIHLSRRVLEAVRADGRAVMASNAAYLNADLGLTVVDRHRPRVVLCAPVTALGETVDVLYLDYSCEQVAPSTLDFVEAVARQLTFARRGLLTAEARVQNETINQQLKLAREIQARLVPTETHTPPEVDASLCYQPAMWVGGDYCSIWPTADGRLAFAVGDVSGKGLPAAMMVANLHGALQTTMAFCPTPQEAMNHVNELLTRNLPEAMFVTLFLGLLDPRTGRLEYVNAGHILPVLVQGPARARELDQARNAPLGVQGGEFTGGAELIRPGTGLLVVTDGITESASPQDELFGTARLQEAAGRAELKSAAAMVQAVTRAAADFRASRPQQDDLTVLALVYRGAGVTSTVG